MQHNTNAVHAFLSELHNHLRKEFPSLKKVLYWSDGAANQYKYYKNFTNLSFHKNDFNGICAGWHFFATSHGKSPCDGIGGRGKRLVTRASLQAPISSHILTAEAMDAWARSNIKNVTFLFVTSDQIIAHTNDLELEERYEGVKTIEGTRSHHAYLPGTQIGTLRMYRVSSDIASEMYTNVHLKESKTVCLDEVCPGKYLACIWDKRWYVGIVLEKTDGTGDLLVKCMKQRGHNFFWPQREDKVIITIDHVICLLSPPLIHGRSGRQYEIAEEDKKTVSTLFAQMIAM